MRKSFYIVPLAIVALVAISVYGWNYGLKKVHKPQTANSKGTYIVSLGDSVAAGDGLSQVGSAGQGAICGLSDSAYPVLVAQNLNADLKQFACSGAGVTNGLLASQNVNGKELPAQLAAANMFITGSDVLITIGANDVGWDGMLIRCAHSNCQSAADLASYHASLAQLQTNLNAALAQIQAAGPAKIIINDYYSLLDNNASCFVSYGITPDKVAWVNAREAELNDVINTAARQVNAVAVPIDFNGNLLCNANPWIQGLTDASPLHPTQAGQQQIATEDEQALSR